jgi:hypothetical protein
MDATQHSTTTGSSCLNKALASQPSSRTPDTVTENGAPAHTTTDNACVDLFAAGVRGSPEEKVWSLFAAAWLQDKTLALSILLNCRDCRDGKGEKQVSYFMALWVRKNHPKTYLLILEELVNHGCYKDLCKIVEILHQKGEPKLGTKTWIELELFAERLHADAEALAKATTSGKVPITLSGKWAPSENLHFAQKQNGNQAWILAHLLYPGDKGAMRRYRLLLVQLRKNLQVVESLMSQGKWDQIDFAKLPAKAHRLLRKALLKRLPEKYQLYLTALSEGKVKVNSTGTQPHELVKTYYSGHNMQVDQLIEGQWSDVVNKLRQKGTLGSAMALSDVSGSMEGDPMLVSIALGILLAELLPEPFKGQVITFSAEPVLHKIQGTTLKDKVQSLKNAKAGLNTNLLAVFKLLLGFAKTFSVTAEDLPKTLFIFTDMQFDTAEQSPWKTTYQTIQDMYAAATYPVPQIVFWNLRDTKASFPVSSNTPGVALVSGFSAELLKTFMSGDIQNMTPTKVMNLTLAPYLSKVQVHPDDL